MLQDVTVQQEPSGCSLEGSSTAANTASVSSEMQLLAALLDAGVSTVLVQADIALHKERWQVRGE